MYPSLAIAKVELSLGVCYTLTKRRGNPVRGFGGRGKWAPGSHDQTRIAHKSKSISIYFDTIS